MLAKLRKRLTYANLMATLAVFIAMGGSAYAAVVITGKNVKNSSLTGVDIKNESLTGADLKALSGKDVTDGSLSAQDFKPGQMPAGPQGPKGDKGDQGDTGSQGEAGPPGLSSVTRESNASATESSDAKAVTASCPAGKVAIAGGAQVIIPAAFGFEFESDLARITNSRPSGETGWSVRAKESAATEARWRLRAFVVCATVAP